MNTIPTAIGLETGAGRTEAHNGLQEWLANNGLQPYLPQLAEQMSYNIATNFAGDGLNWDAATLDAVRKFPHPMIFHYNGFYYSTRPSALRWEGRSQDQLSIGLLTSYLAKTRQWLAANGIARPWIMVDEPPPDTSERWTQEIEDRIIKFVQAAQAAGWTIGVCVPGPSQLAYWAARLVGVRWIVSAKHSAGDYQVRTGREWPADNEDVWLYNRRDTMTGLAQQMRMMGATGYLHWAAEWRELPLARIVGNGANRQDYEILPAMHELLAELQSIATAVTLESLDARVLAIESQLRAR